MKNITVENTAGPGHIAGQALAIYVAADRCSFINCRFEGWQDTIFLGDSISCQMKKLMLPDHFAASSVPIHYPQIRNYFKDCFISGDVDFIFGPNIAFFENCEIFSRKRQSEDRAFITAASTPQEQEFGLVFSHCNLTGECGENNTYLGRPWRDYAKTVFIHCYMHNHICPEGWHNWGRVKAEVSCNYVEYDNAGPGACPNERAFFAKCLSNPELEKYFSKENVLKGEDNWRP